MTPELEIPEEERLRRQIFLAPPGATIYVEPGEHNGPFVFSRPINLVGKALGSIRPTLYTLRGPVAIVESPNVALDNLEFVIGDGDYRQIDPALVHAPYCRPILKDVQFGKGRLEDMTNANQTSGWEIPTMIAFGELREKAWVALPLDVKVPGPTTVRSMFSGMRIEPDHLPAAGEYHLTVYFGEGALIKDSMLAGQLVFDYSGESKTVWIIGNVLAEKDFKAKGYPELVLATPSGRVYTSTETFMLGRGQFQGERGADRWADGLAFVIKETGQVWSLVQTRPQPVSLRLNRQPVLVGHRQVLKEGDELEIGDMKFQVLPKGKKASLDVSGVINFGKLSKLGTPEGADPRLVVENRSKNADWQGRLRSTVPWIVVPGEKFICPRGQKVSVQLALDMTQLGKLPKGQQPFYGALVLENDKEAWVVKALLDIDVDVTRISLEIQPRTLDFKKLARPEEHPGLKVTVRNTGSMDWSGTLRSVKWLTVVPSSLAVAPGKAADVAVNLNANMADLLEGPNSEAEALVIEGQQLRETVAARIERVVQRPFLQVSPAELDFGSIQDWHSAVVRLVVRNNGTADWQGEVKTMVDWLEIADSRGQVVQGMLRLPSQGKADLVARLKQSPAAGTYSEPAAVQWVRENRSEVTLSLKAVVEELKIEPDPGMIDFKITDAPASREKILRIWNRSGQTWVGEVLPNNLSWLVVSPTHVTIPPNQVVSVTVGVDMKQVMGNDRLRNNKVKPLADAIYLQSGGVVVAQVGASIMNTLTGPNPPPPPPPPPLGKLQLETVEVDFGRLPKPGDSLPAREILLSNIGDSPVECSMRALVDWLNVEPLRFTVAPKEQLRLKAMLNENARKLIPDRHVREDGVQIEWDNQSHNVRVALTVEKPPLPPLQVEKIDFGVVNIPVKEYPGKEISIFNSLFFPVEVVSSASENWLTITPERIQCPSKQTCTVNVALNDKVAALPEGPVSQDNAVTVQIGQTIKRYLVTLELRKATIPIIETAKYVIDFGDVHDFSAGFPSRSFQLTNNSDQPKEGRVLATNFVWLTITPTEFRIEPRSRVDLKVQLTKSAKARVYDEESAIVIELSGTQIPIRVKANISKTLTSVSMPASLPVPPAKAKTTPPPPAEPAYPELDLAKGAEQLTRLQDVLDFGSYTITPDPLPAHTVALVNSSSQPVSGTISIRELPWLTVEPAQFKCPPGGKVLLRFSLSDEVRRLRPKGKPYRAPDAVCIETGAQTFCLRASVQVQIPAAP